MDYVLIRRQDEDGLALQLLSASLSRAMAAPGGEADVLLQPDDEVIVFSLEENQAGDLNDGKKHDTDSRQAILTPLLKRVRDINSAFYATCNVLYCRHAMIYIADVLISIGCFNSHKLKTLKQIMPISIGT